jgi:hypothetical protein
MPRPSPVTPSQVQEILALYQTGTSRNQLARMFKASRQVINCRLEQHGIHVRTLKEACPGFPLRHDAFASPETDPEAAYWAGFLMADGCISENGYHGSPHVILQLSATDIGHIRSFQQFVGSTLHTIRDIEPKTNRHNFKSGRCARIDLVSKQMVADLARHGVTPKKTHTAKVSDALAFNRDFWRGVIDGDGNIRLAEHRKGCKPQPIIQMTGSLPLTTQFAAFAIHIAGGKTRPCKSRGSYNIALYCGVAVRLITALYSDCTVALPRKLAKAQEVLSRFK